MEFVETNMKERSADFGTVLRRNVLRWSAAAVLGGVMGFGVAFLLPPKWEAATLIRIGKVKGQLVEPVHAAVERIKLQPFQQRVAELADPPNEGGKRATRMRSVKARAMPGTDLVEVKLRGPAQEDARAQAAAVVKALQEVHQQVSAPTVDHLQRHYEETRRQLDAARAAREDVLARLAAQRQTSDLLQPIVMSNILAHRDTDIRALEQRLYMVEEALGPLLTYPTSAVDAIHTDPFPTVIQRMLGLVFGALAGLVIAVAIALRGSR
jgi:hypothetical protein